MKTHARSKSYNRPARSVPERLELVVLLDLRTIVLSCKDLGDGEPVHLLCSRRERCRVNDKN